MKASFPPLNETVLPAQAQYILALLMKPALITLFVSATWELLKGKVLLMFVSAAPGRVPGAQSRLSRTVYLTFAEFNYSTMQIL